MMIRNCARTIFFKLEQTIIALRAQVFLFFLVLTSSLLANVGNPIHASSGEPIFIINKIASYSITKTGIIIAGTTKVFNQTFVNSTPFYKIILPEISITFIDKLALVVST